MTEEQIFIKEELEKEIQGLIKEGILREDSEVIWNETKKEFEINWQYSPKYAEKLLSQVDLMDVKTVFDKNKKVRDSEEDYDRIENLIFK